MYRSRKSIRESARLRRMYKNMEMKWHPIANGDLSGIQQQETLLLIDTIARYLFVDAVNLVEDEKAARHE